MLFPYTYVPHQMDRMQEFIDFIFHEVWCKAPLGLVFHPDLFDGNHDLKEVMSEFGFSAQAAERGRAFYRDVKGIYELFASLSPEEVSQFKQWYKGNNDIEKVCNKDPEVQLARYADIAVTHPEIAYQLGIFFKGLYSQSLLDLAALRARIGDIENHYKAFVTTNSSGKCPFCGIADLLGKDHNKREPYDHYLPKAFYPFNSINFKNLVPACHHCNSSYKTSKDPAYTSKDSTDVAHRRAVFYPYAVVPYAIHLQIALQHNDIEKLKPEDITLQFGPEALSEKIDTWRDVYGIDERYRNKLCGENEGKYWLTQVLDEGQAYGKQPTDILNTRAEQAQTRPYADCNFLRKPFLDACKNCGIFEAVATALASA